MTDVTVYTKPRCQPCKATIRMLTKLGVDFETVDASEDDAALEYIKGFGYLESPVIVLGDGSHWSGHRPELLQQLAVNVD